MLFRSAVKQLHDMGLADTLAGYHKMRGLRVVAHGRTLEMPWPSHGDYPDYGYVVRRCELDTFVAQMQTSPFCVRPIGPSATRMSP